MNKEQIEQLYNLVARKKELAQEHETLRVALNGFSSAYFGVYYYANATIKQKQDLLLSGSLVHFPFNLNDEIKKLILDALDNLQSEISLIELQIQQL